MTVRAFLTLAMAAMAAIALANPLWAQSETIYVFANKDVPDSALTQADIKNMYLGKKDKWSDNQKAACTMLSRSECRESFIKQYLSITDYQYDNYWKKQIFTGSGQPPRQFETSAEMIDFVSRTTGAIGFSCTQPDAGKVKILTVN